MPKDGITHGGGGNNTETPLILSLGPQQVAKYLRGEARGNKITCPGPGHSPHDRSLSVLIDSAAPDGFTVNSFAGDDPLACRDHVRSQIGDDAWKPKANVKAGASRIVAEYDYEDETGSVLFQAVRMQPKNFRQRRPDGKGGWIWSLKGVRLVPYRLPELMEAVSLGKHIYVVEGEKDVEALRKLGLAATCNPMGAEKWRDAYSDHLRGADVIIIPDNDAPGQRHAERVAKSLAGVANSVKTVRLPALSEGGDASDWIAAGGTADKLMRICDAWVSNGIADAARKTSGATPAKQAFNWRSGTISASTLSQTALPDVIWTIPQIMPEGVAILAAKPKVGKSWMTLAWCIAVASERKDCDLIFDNEYQGIRPRHGSVLYLALEDNQRRMKSRLAKVCISSPDHLHIATEWPRCSEGGIDAIEEWIIDRTEACKRGECPPPALIAIDTLAKFRPPAKRLGDAYSQDYEAIAPLKSLADKYALSVIIVHHQRKMDSDDPFDSVSGTLGLTGAADTIMIMVRKDGGVVFLERGRDVEENEIAIQFNRETGKWKALGAPQEVMRSSNDKAIIAVLKEAYLENEDDDGRAVGLDDLKQRSAVKMSKPVFKAHVARMAKDGRIERAERGKYRFVLR